MWLVENLDLSPARVFWVGSALVLSRVLHFAGMNFPKIGSSAVEIGELLSFAILVWLSVVLLSYYLAP